MAKATNDNSNSPLPVLRGNILVCPVCKRKWYDNDCQIEKAATPDYCLCGRNLAIYPIVTDEEWLEFFGKVTTNG